MAKKSEGGGFCALPEGCIANVLSLTSPPDACKLSVVSRIFRSAAESDAVWESFLPPCYESIISTSSHSYLLASSPSKKHLFLTLCNNPILIDHGRKSFSLDKWSGKKCYMLSARDLSIIWSDTPEYWGWISDPDSRFEEVAELLAVCWLEIRGKINASMLSPTTLYAAFLVFKLTEEAYGLEMRPAEVAVGLVGTEICTKSVYLDTDTTAQSDEQYPKERGDGWLEIELGEFFINERGGGELEMSVLEVKGGNWKRGLIVQGIEIRPKASK